MNKTGKKQQANFQFAGKIALTMVGSALICIFLLFVTGLIPQKAIEDSCRESSEYFKEHEM